MICVKNYENIFKFVIVTHTILQTLFQTRCTYFRFRPLFLIVALIGIAQVHFLRVCRGRMPQVRRWNFDDICHTFGDTTTFGQLAAILHFRHEVASAMIARDLDVSYIVINPCNVFGTTCVYVKPAKLLVLPVIWLPSWISNTHIDVPRNRRYHHQKIESLTPKAQVQPLEFCRCVLQNSRYASGNFTPPPSVAGKRRKKPLPGEGLKYCDEGVCYNIEIQYLNTERRRRCLAFFDSVTFGQMQRNIIQAITLCNRRITSPKSAQCS